jgi:hypothetical protein
MIKIPLSKNGKKNKGKYFAIVDDCDADLLIKNWQVLVPHSSLTGKTNYAVRSYRKKPFRMHNVIAQRFLGECPDGYCVDHINFDGLDNRRSNIRYLKKEDNCKRRSKYNNNSSGVTGLNYCKRDDFWILRQTIAGKRKTIGYFKSKIDAERFLGIYE